MDRVNRSSLAIKGILLSIFALCGGSTLASNNIQAFISNLDSHGASSELGAGIRADISLSDRWYFVGDILRNDIRFENSEDAYLVEWTLGIGYEYQISQKSHLFIELVGKTQELKDPNTAVDARGSEVTVGYKREFNDKWNLTAFTRYTDVNLSSSEPRGSDFFLGAEIQYKIDDKWRLAARLEKGDFSRTDIALILAF